MLFLSVHRRFVPACLALGAFCALPALADPPAVPAVQAFVPQIIVLQHVLPNDLLKSLHWDQFAKLPAGVTQVQSVPAQNALSVTATPAGLAEVRHIVQSLDIEPRQVQVKFALAYASDAGLKAAHLASDHYAAGLPAVRLLKILTEQKAIGASTTLTTANCVSASMSLFYGPTTPLTFGVTPHVNIDQSLSLVLDAAVPGGIIKNEAHTVQSGDTLVIIKTPASPNAAKKEVLLFVTPTLQ